MTKYIYRLIMKLTDGILYGFVGPFSVLYIIPQFLMKLSNFKSQGGFGIPVVELCGLLFLWIGAALAIWCTILMNFFGEGTPFVNSAPRKILTRNVYSYVRHPMMWSLLFVIFGEALMYGQPILFVWLIALARILRLIVSNYEEPQLERRFGESWTEYCQKVPCWFPNFRKNKVTAAIISQRVEIDHD